MGAEEFWQCMHVNFACPYRQRLEFDVKTHGLIFGTFSPSSRFEHVGQLVHGEDAFPMVALHHSGRHMIQETEVVLLLGLLRDRHAEMGKMDNACSR